MTTLFSWGYFGWGNATGELVHLVDAVEQARGFAPPLFVDTRIRRAVRAVGFQGSAFAGRLGGRYVWMQGLGNEAIRTGEGGIRIARPDDAGRLLDLALADKSRRVLFFCGCRWPKQDGRIVCHRCTVAGLVLQEAARRGEASEVIEWPGEAPRWFTLEPTPEVRTALRRRAAYLPFSADAAVALQGPPWGSVAALELDAGTVRLLVGPAALHGGVWRLPMYDTFNDPQTPEEVIRDRIAAFRRQHGLDSCRVGT